VTGDSSRHLVGTGSVPNDILSAADSAKMTDDSMLVGILKFPTPEML
jgi:hypothetical protein